MLLQQKSDQMGNNLAEQQVNNDNKAKKMINTRTTPFTLSQVQKTYDFGNIENCELNIDFTLTYPHLHPLMYYVCRNPHRRASPFL